MRPAITKFLIALSVACAAFSIGDAQAQSVSIGSQAAALARAGDVDGAAALVAQVFASNPDAGRQIMQEVASSNPSVAGAILNITVRTIGQTSGTSGVQSIIESAVAGTLDGVTQASNSGQPDAPSTAELAENIAVNVRQAIVVVSGGDEATQNSLLGSARAGVQSSTLAQQSTSQQPGAQNTANNAQSTLNALQGQLVGILNSRLSTGITQQEATTLTSTATANNQPAPIVITRTGTSQNNTPVVTTPIVNTPTVTTTTTGTTVVTPPIQSEAVGGGIINILVTTGQPVSPN